MIQTEQLTIGNTPFTRTWSDANRYVVREGISYDEALDPTDQNRTYTEGDIIHDESEAPENIEEAAQFLVQNGLVELPTEEEPDYLNEHEQEPNYFNEVRA